MKISGTSGGVGFEAAHVFRTTNVNINTTASDGNDTITLTSANNAHANTNLSINTGAATDLVNVNGQTTFAGSLSITTVDVSGSAGGISTGTGLFITNANTGTLAIPLSGAGGLTKSGPGTLVLHTGNSYGGATSINQGVLNIRNSSALGTTAGDTTVASGATLQVQGGLSIAEPLTLNGSGVAGSGALENVTGNNTWTGSITLASDSSIGVDISGETLGISGSVGESGGAQGLTKVGPGTLTLSDNNNTYSGNTTISAGVLSLAAASTNNIDSSAIVNVGGGAFLNVTGLASGGIAISSLQSLIGNGTVVSNVKGMGTFSPGNSPGTMTIMGNFTPMGTVNFEVNSPYATAGTDYGQYIVSGTVNLSAATLTFTNNIPGAAPAIPNLVTLISKTSGGAVTPKRQSGRREQRADRRRDVQDLLQRRRRQQRRASQRRHAHDGLRR